MWWMRISGLAAYLMLSTAWPHASAAQALTDQPFWTGYPDVAAFEGRVEDDLSRSRQALDRMLQVEGERTVENTLAPYDEARLSLENGIWQARLIANVHPDSSMRAAAERMMAQASTFESELMLNRQVYDALAELDVSQADKATQYYLERTLRDFRLAGVDKDEETRRKIKALRDELVLTGQEFSRNIREDVRTVIVDDPAELEGLPADYIARHHPDADGKIRLTTDYPDALPVFSYATHEDLRRRMHMAFENRAYPQNMPVLERMIAKRHELAHLLGFENWADYATADRMVGSEQNASDFIDQVVEASRAAMEHDYQVLLQRKRQEVPDASVINAWERVYWTERVKQSDYNFDSQQVRPYFSYERVKQGVLDITSRLFGVSFQQVQDMPVWDASVEGWEMYEDGRLVGRFYLDMHPRTGKFKHAALSPIRNGVAGRQLPEAALLCNFPGGEKGDPGLMEHSQVRTFFHEFGHLMHHLLGGRQRWHGISGIKTEHDFVEAPSKMLEEWIWDPATLATFATHYKTGEPIPAELAVQMERANEFGKGLYVRLQSVYARLSLSLHNRPPAEADPDALMKAATEAYSPFPYVEGTHMPAAFSHLIGYTAAYYTYVWSEVIAKDMFSRFDRQDLLAPGVAKRYRDAVLAPGGSAPAAKLVENFLGRPYNLEAWQKWLNNEHRKQ